MFFSSFRIFLFVIFLLLFPAIVQAKAYQVTALHTAITEEDEWLNTSRTLRAEDLKGRIILLDFWTYCCINCIHVVPDLQYLEDTFGEKLTVIGVHSAKFDNEKEADNIRLAILRYGIKHPVVNDDRFAIWRSFGVNAWPSLVLIAPDGQIYRRYSGEGNRAYVERDIRELLNKYKDTINDAPLPIALEKDKEPRRVLHFPGKIEYVEDFEGEPALFVSDSGHHRIVAMRPNGQIFMEIGSGEQGAQDGSIESARFNKPQGLLYHQERLYIADTGNHMLRMVRFDTRTVETLAGTGERGFNRHIFAAQGRKSALASLWDIAVHPEDSSTLLLAMAGTHQIWSYDIDRNTLSVFAGNGRESIDDGYYPFNSLSQPSGLSAYGKTLYFIDAETSALRMLEGRKLTTLIGTGLFDFGLKDGTRDTARMQHPLGLFAAPEGVYIADAYNHAIRFYDYASTGLSTVIGDGNKGVSDGTFDEAALHEPNDVLKAGNLLYIADTNNHVIRRADLNTRQIITLPVMPRQKPVSYTHKDTLPNLEEKQEILVHSGDVRVSLRLEKGWKINTDAPSWLALFYKSKEGIIPIKQYNKKDISEGMLLPELEQGTEHILQGTLYYCEEVNTSLCLIRSIHYPLMPIDTTPAKESHITIDLTTPSRNK